AAWLHESSGTSGDPGSRESIAAHAAQVRAERIAGEQKCPASIVEGVEQNLNIVIGVDVVAIGERRPNALAMDLVGADPEVNRIGRVEDEDVGRIGRRPAIDRPVLRKPLEQRRLAPYGIVQHAVDSHGRIDARNGDADLPKTAVVDCLLYAWRLNEKKENGEHGTKLRAGEVRREMYGPSHS